MKKRLMNIALGQMYIESNNTDANLSKILRMVDEAVEKGADIVIFPELAYTGYLLEAEELQRLAEPMDGPFIQTLKKKAKEKRIHIIAGYTEADAVIPGRIYNSCIFIDDEGKTLENMRKFYLWGQEKLKFREGNRLPVVETKFGKIGMLICYDVELPEPSRIEALKGAELIIDCSFWSIPAQRRWDVDLAGNALFNVLYMVGVNAVGDNTCGRSQIVGPDGEVIAIASNEDEEVLVQAIDLNRVVEVRSRLPYLNDFKEDTFSMDAINKF